MAAKWLLFILLLGFGTAAPVMAADGPRSIRVGFLVTSLSDIDVAGGSFGMQAYAWFVDPDGTFDPTAAIQVLARTATIEKIAERTLPNGARYTAVRIQATLDQTYDVAAFPFDRQTLRLSIETPNTSSELQLEPDLRDTRLADFARLAGWNVRGLRFEARDLLYDTHFGYHDTLPSFSRLSLLVDIERQRSVLVIEKFIGYTMALLITVLIYLVPTDQLGVRIGMVTSAIFATVGNRYSLDAVLGADSVFGLVDQISLIVFASIYTALAVSLLASHVRQAHGHAIAHRVNRWSGALAVPLYTALAVAAFVHAHA